MSDHNCYHPPFTATPIGERVVWSGIGNIYVAGKFYAIGKPDPIEPYTVTAEQVAAGAAFAASFRKRSGHGTGRPRGTDTPDRIVAALRRLGKPSTVEEIAAEVRMGITTVWRTMQSDKRFVIHTPIRYHNNGCMPALWELKESND